MPDGQIVEATPQEALDLVESMLPVDLPERKKKEIVRKTRIVKQKIVLPKIELDDGFNGGASVGGSGLLEASLAKGAKCSGVRCYCQPNQLQRKRRKMAAAMLLLL